MAEDKKAPKALDDDLDDSIDLDVLPQDAQLVVGGSSGPIRSSTSF